MNKGHRHRKLSNVMLTKRHHFSHMGLWILVGLVLVVTLNMLMYLLMEERWTGIGSLSQPFHQEYITFRMFFLLALTLESIFFGCGIVALAMYTDHRITGPYIRLQHVFDAIRDGNMDQRLKFRDYDNLEYLADSFNAMMVAIRERTDQGFGDSSGEQ